MNSNKQNEGVSTILIIIGVIVIVGLGLYFFSRRSSVDERAINTLQEENILPAPSSDSNSDLNNNSEASAAAQEDTVEYPGRYSSRTTLASGEERDIQLQISEDGTATFSSNQVGSNVVERQEGIWTVDPSGVLVVTLNKSNGTLVERPSVLTFRKTDQKLVAASYEQSLWGEGGLELTQVN